MGMLRSHRQGVSAVYEGDMKQFTATYDDQQLGGGEGPETHVGRTGGAKPIVREHAALTEVLGPEEGTLEGEVPVRHGHGGVDGLQGLFEHEGQAHVRGHEARSLVPVVAVLGAA